MVVKKKLTALVIALTLTASVAYALTATEQLFSDLYLCNALRDKEKADYHAMCFAINTLATVINDSAYPQVTCAFSYSLPTQQKLNQEGINQNSCFQDFDCVLTKANNHLTGCTAQRQDLADDLIGAAQTLVIYQVRAAQ